MSDEASAPAGGDTNGIAVITPAADTPAVLSVSEAARALAAARHRPKEPAPVEQPEADPVEPDELDAQASDADPEEAPGEEPSEAKPEEIPPLEPPRSWTKAEKERFQTLPRETQEYLHTREQERDREFRRTQNEAAEKLKGLTTREQEVERLRQQYEAKLPALMQTLNEVGPFGDIRTMQDVEKLQAEDPFRFQQYQLHQWKLQAHQAELKETQERQTREQQTQWATFVQKENDLAAEYIPELADKTKGPAIMASAIEQLKELGFKDEELGKFANGEKVSPFDHRIQRLLFKALKFDEIKAAPAKAIAKPVPPVTRPGTSRPQGQAQSEAVQALERKLTQSGSLKDAQALRALQLSRRRA